jgi:hypothetical protein
MLVKLSEVLQKKLTTYSEITKVCPVSCTTSRTTRLAPVGDGVMLTKENDKAEIMLTLINYIFFSHNILLFCSH